MKEDNFCRYLFIKMTQKIDIRGLTSQPSLSLITGGLGASVGVCTNASKYHLH